MKGWVKLVLIGVAAVAAAELYLRAPSGGELQGAAPALALPDLAGREVTLAGLRGKVVAVNFWASWCAPCRAEIPDLAQVYAAHKGGCFEMLGIAQESGSRDEVAESASRFGISYPVLLDPQGAAGDAFRVQGYPRTYLIDHRGQIRQTFAGAVDREELEGALKPLLAEAPPSCP